jgi:hypothetical protein
MPSHPPSAAQNTPPQPASPAQPAAPVRRPGDEVPEGSPGSGENVCRRCGGTGQIQNSPCPDCNGSGKVTVGIGGG